MRFEELRGTLDIRTGVEEVLDQGVDHWVRTQSIINPEYVEDVAWTLHLPDETWPMVTVVVSLSILSGPRP